MLSRIKREHRFHRVGFNGSAKPLGEREDLDKLAEIALRSGDPSLLKLFEKLPTIKQLEFEKTRAFLKKTELPKPIESTPPDAKGKDQE